VNYGAFSETFLEEAPFVDEISEMTLAIQGQAAPCFTGAHGRAGEISIEVRIIAIINRDLDKPLPETLFREDIYYRLNVIPIRVPSSSRLT
jgi:transcriptional regulator with PAS, ATPase and Fis domain